ncbi:MAG: DnaJ family domain-containing protein [Thiomonas sp.]
MNALAWIGAARIAQAVQDGAFDHLPGAGRPLNVLERARKLPCGAAARQRERAQLRLLWTAALGRKGLNHQRQVPAGMARTAEVDAREPEPGRAPRQPEAPRPQP